MFASFDFTRHENHYKHASTAQALEEASKTLLKLSLAGDASATYALAGCFAKRSQIPEFSLSQQNQLRKFALTNFNKIIELTNKDRILASNESLNSWQKRWDLLNSIEQKCQYEICELLFNQLVQEKRDLTIGVETLIKKLENLIDVKFVPAACLLAKTIEEFDCQGNEDSVIYYYTLAIFSHHVAALLPLIQFYKKREDTQTALVLAELYERSIGKENIDFFSANDYLIFDSIISSIFKQAGCATHKNDETDVNLKKEKLILSYISLLFRSIDQSNPLCFDSQDKKLYLEIIERNLNYRFTVLDKHANKMLEVLADYKKVEPCLTVSTTPSVSHPDSYTFEEAHKKSLQKSNQETAFFYLTLCDSLSDGNNTQRLVFAEALIQNDYTYFEKKESCYLIYAKFILDDLLKTINSNPVLTYEDLALKERALCSITDIHTSYYLLYPNEKKFEAELVKSLCTLDETCMLPIH